MNTPHDRVLTVSEVAEYLKLKKSTVYRLAQRDRIPGVKVGRHWRFHREVIDAWLRRDPQTGPASAER